MYPLKICEISEFGPSSEIKYQNFLYPINNLLRKKNSYRFEIFPFWAPFYVKNGNNDMHYSERNFQKEFIKNNFQIKIRGRISSLCTNNRNINFCTLGPDVWKWVGLQYPKSISNFIQCQG